MLARLGLSLAAVGSSLNMQGSTFSLSVPLQLAGVVAEQTDTRGWSLSTQQSLAYFHLLSVRPWKLNFS
jgi:hypothetical protein